MNKRLLQLELLVAWMQSRYGEQDPDVQRLRLDLDALQADDKSGLGPLRYPNRSIQEDRSNRVTPLL